MLNVYITDLACFNGYARAANLITNRLWIALTETWHLSNKIWSCTKELKNIIFYWMQLLKMLLQVNFKFPKVIQNTKMYVQNNMQGCTNDFLYNMILCAISI